LDIHNLWKDRIASIRIVAVYVLFASLWILLTDSIVTRITENPDLMQRISVFKGLVFVLITAFLLYHLINRHVRRMSAANSLLQENMAYLQVAHDKLKLTDLLIDNLSDSIQWITMDGRFWNVNRAACRMLGYSREELLSLTISDIDPYITFEEWQSHLQEIKQLGSMQHTRFHKTKDGRIFPIEITSNYFNYDDTEYYCAIVRDITDRVKAENEASFFKSLIEYTRDPFYVLTPDDGFRMVYANQAACKHYGMDLEQLQSMNILDWYPAFDMGSADALVRQQKDGKSARFETMHKVASGKLIPVEVTASLLVHDGREYHCGYFHDITERKVMENALRESEERYRTNCNLLQSILESSPDVIVFALDTNCNYLAFNTRHKEAIKAIWGMEIAIGMNMLEVIGDVTDRERARVNFARALSGESFTLEEWYGDEQLSRECWLDYYSPIHSDAEDVTGMTCFVQNITDRKRIEGELVAREQQFRSLVENSPDIVIRYDTKCRRILVNPALIRLVGKPAATLLGVAPTDYPLGIETVNYQNALKQALENGKEVIHENIWRGVGDRTIISHFRIVPEFGANGRVAGVLAIGRDITELKLLEEQLNQSQKMEAVGQLAGGIAHDFNNIMTAIIGFAHIIGMKVGQESSLNCYLDKILASAERASSLTRDLLTFSRKEVMQLKPIDSREAIAGSQQLISRLLREDIELTISLSDEPLTVMAGENQLTQILMNLAANARDAMPSGGKITIAVSSFTMDQEYVERHGYGKKGIFSLIAFADTGCGMDEKTREKIFEPFFTTKEVGQGTGLGLATVYGIVKQLGGFINVYSEPEKGTIFRIYLPLAGSVATTEEKILADVPLYDGTETLLLAEDEPLVREIEETLLREAGYKIISARDGNEALRLFSDHRDSIDLLVLDAIMPGKNGIDVFREIQKIDPQIKVIMVSGYTSEMMIVSEFIEKGMKFMQKPVNPSEFLQAIREVLDR
jgi:PAS domain S-box-containing protein